MNHYTDKDMTSKEFISLLQTRLASSDLRLGEKGLSIDGYSYGSTNMKLKIEETK